MTTISTGSLRLQRCCCKCCCIGTMILSKPGTPLSIAHAGASHSRAFQVVHHREYFRDRRRLHPHPFHQVADAAECNTCKPCAAAAQNRTARIAHWLASGNARAHSRSLCAEPMDPNRNTNGNPLMRIAQPAPAVTRFTRIDTARSGGGHD